MRLLLLACLLFVLCGRGLAHAHAAANSATPAWNGTDLAGWTVVMEDTTPPHSVWRIHDGILSLHAKSRGYVRTNGAYQDYVLRFSWRWPEAPPVTHRRNSGVLFHLTGADKIWPKSYELQLLSGLAGELVAFDHDLPGGVPHPRDGIKRGRMLAPASEKPEGQWNTAEVTCRGATVEIRVNGVLQNRVSDLPVTRGHIAFQLEGAPTEFRDIALMPLGSGERGQSRCEPIVAP